MSKIKIFKIPKFIYLKIFQIQKIRDSNENEK